MIHEEYRDLATVQQIVSAHEGILSVEKSLLGGALVRVQLPLGKAVAAA